jgi:RNA polymerase sigma factor (sigma-70 family)
MEVLLAERDAFIRFVRARVESDAAAEEIVQNAFLRSLEHQGELREDESATAWFYRILRNAVVDHYRRRDVAGRAAERIAAEMPEAIDEVPADERNRVCACVKALASSLKAEYAGMLEKIDVEGRSLGEVAEEEGITTNNATVRLHRARQALKKRVEDTCKSCAKHGCVDCTCQH